MVPYSDGAAIWPGWHLVTVALLLAAAGATTAAEGQTGKWGDQGDGTYRNPIIAADFSDPDVIRVGEDYYLVASTFESSPGVPVLHSRDLVNWEIIGSAIPDAVQLGPEFNWDRMNRYNEGVYAPSIRHHDGRFWVFVNVHSGEGFFCCTATDPAGPWTVTQIKDKNGSPLRTHGWTDPCPFWDDDGKAYLTASRPGGKWFGYLFQMTPDGTTLLDADAAAMNRDGTYAYPDGGTLFSPFQSTEGNKLFKRNGWYYLQHIEFLATGNGAGTYLMRSRNLYGTKADGTPGRPGDPGTYEILKLGRSLPGQGGLVDTPDGRWFWLAQFNRYGSDGRTPNLVPATWIDDWPVIGVDIADRQGAFAWQLPNPIPGGAIRFPQGDDEFTARSLLALWSWNHQPRAGKWSLDERPGFLRLHAFAPAGRGFYKIGNVLSQRHCRSLSTTATIRLEPAGMSDGQEAGLAHFTGGKTYATIAIRQTGGERRLIYEESGTTTDGPVLPHGLDAIWLRSDVGFSDVNAFSYSFDGAAFLPFGGAYKLGCVNYRGDRIGIYTVGTSDASGYVDVDFFHYSFVNR